jgi:hypothetical protein
MLGEPDPVEAQRFGQIAERQRGLHALIVRGGGRGAEIAGHHPFPVVRVLRTRTEIYLHIVPLLR